MRSTTGRDRSLSLSNCTITGLSRATTNGKLIEAKVLLSSSYACNGTAIDGCWIRGIFSFPSTVAGVSGTVEVNPTDVTG